MAADQCVDIGIDGDHIVSIESNGLIEFALGTDCGGSIRLPASYCGILGIRPNLGRVAVEGIVPFSASFDVVGWSDSKHRALVTPAKRGKGSSATTPGEPEAPTLAEHRASMRRAQRLERVFNIDIETCQECSGAVKVIASIEAPEVIKKILTHLDIKVASAESRRLPTYSRELGRDPRWDCSTDTDGTSTPGYGLEGSGTMPVGCAGGVAWSAPMVCEDLPVVAREFGANSSPSGGKLLSG